MDSRLRGNDVVAATMTVSMASFPLSRERRRCRNHGHVDGVIPAFAGMTEEGSDSDARSIRRRSPNPRLQARPLPRPVPACRVRGARRPRGAAGVALPPGCRVARLASAQRDARRGCDPRHRLEPPPARLPRPGAARSRLRRRHVRGAGHGGRDGPLLRDVSQRLAGDPGHGAARLPPLRGGAPRRGRKDRTVLVPVGRSGRRPPGRFPAHRPEPRDRGDVARPHHRRRCRADGAGPGGVGTEHPQGAGHARRAGRLRRRGRARPHRSAEHAAESTTGTRR